MTICREPVFEMAPTQFITIADHLCIPEGRRDRPPYPKRAIAVS